MAEQVNPLDRRIYWLASYPKSGSTWIRMLLNAYATGFPPDINSAFQFCRSDLHPPTFQLTCSRAVDTLTVREQMIYYPAVLLNLLHAANQKNLYLKTHHAKVRVDDTLIIPTEFSQAAVYVIRDPRDIVFSCMAHFKHEDIGQSIEMLADQGRFGLLENIGLAHAFLDWSTHVKSWTTNNKDVPVLVVRYEDLLEEPENVLISIIKHFDMPELGPERIQFAVDATKFDKLQKQEKKHGFKERVGNDLFFRRGEAGQWKEGLGMKELKLIENKHRQMMEFFKYVPVTEGPTDGKNKTFQGESETDGILAAGSET